MRRAPSQKKAQDSPTTLLGGSWDSVTGVIIIIKVTVLRITCNPLRVLITVLTKSHDPPSITSYQSQCCFGVTYHNSSISRPKPYHSIPKPRELRGLGIRIFRAFRV